MATRQHKKYFISSIVFHLMMVGVLLLGFDFATPLIVVENTHKNDVISAVILGDIQTSKILPQPEPVPKPIQQIVKDEPKIKPIEQPPIKKEKEVVGLKPVFGKDLLADLEKLKKQSDKQKKEKQQKLKQHFEKMLHEQAEKSMRQQLLNEDIKLKGTQTREAQGIVNKYQALILQAISEHWIVPSQANKKLSSVLAIRLAPGGVVLDVQVIKSSGDVALDNSARSAVLRASPLPVPADSIAFESFRQFHLKAKPQDIVNNDGIAG